MDNKVLIVLAEDKYHEYQPLFVVDGDNKSINSHYKAQSKLRDLGYEARQMTWGVNSDVIFYNKEKDSHAIITSIEVVGTQ